MTLVWEYIHLSLDEVAFEKATKAGSVMVTEQAIVLALEE